VGFAPTFYFGWEEMSKPSFYDEIYRIAADVAEKNDLELVHVETLGAGKNFKVRIFIDKPAGVSHEDCSLVSREVGDALDRLDLIPSAYLLEVSSPGLERELYSLQDFERFAGSLARVKTSAPIDGQRNFRGRILNIKGEEIYFLDKTRGEVNFPYQAVAKANLEIDLEEELKRK
jgi:ribosome maturation factor RimP